MSISEPFIKRPVATSLLAVGLFLFGVLAYVNLPVAPLPRVDMPTVSVNASLPGADSETMAASVAAPLERRFGQIAGVTELTSVSSLGSTSLTLQFDLNRKIDDAVRDVQAAINAAGGELPLNLPSPPTFRKVNPADSPILILALNSPTLPPGQVYDYADQVLAQRIAQVSGVSQVNVSGAQKSAVRVQADPAKMAALGLSLDDVRLAVVNATVNQPKGSLDGVTESWAIWTNDQLLHADDYKKVVVVTRNGTSVRLGDAANVIEGPENTRVAGWFNREKAVLLIIFKQPDANVIETVEGVKALLPQLRSWIPPSVTMTVMLDRTLTIRASVKDVQMTLLITTGLVVMVVFLFLRRFWVTFAASITVPLALTGTFAAMYLCHYTLDNLSLMALTISVGFVVDDAIVMIENVMRYIEEGMQPRDAALKGAKQIGFTVMSISISLIAVFIPLLFMGGVVGRLFHEFAVTLSLAIGLSALVSLTLTPMLCATLVKAQPPLAQRGRFDRASEAFLEKVVDGYDRMLGSVLRHPTLTLLSFLAVLGTTVYLYTVVPKGFFPEQDTGVMMGQIQSAPDTSFLAMSTLQQKVAATVLQDPAVEGLGSFIGGGGSAGITGRMFIALKPKSQRDTVFKVVERLRPKLARIEGVRAFLTPVQDIRVGGRQSSASYQYALADQDLKELGQWTPLLVEKLRSLPQLKDVNSDQLAGGFEAQIRVDRNAASRLGVQLVDIDTALYNAFGQRQIANLYEELNQYHVILEAMPSSQLDPSALSSIYVKTAEGRQVPLSAVAKVGFGNSPLSVTHQSQFPAATVSFNLAPGVSLGQASDLVEQASAQIGMPASVHGSFQGTAQVFAQSLKNEPILILAALLAVYLVLGILYESLIHPLTILSTLPSAGLGALLAMLLVGDELSVISTIGIVLLIGIVKKNGIILVDFALEAERQEGLSPEESIRKACRLRFRPILMTTFAALFGALPLALGQGVGSELRRPLGIAIVGGLVVSQLLTLFTTPVVYLSLDRLSKRWHARKRVTRPAVVTP